MTQTPEEFIEALDVAIGLIEVFEGESDEDKEALAEMQGRLVELRRRISLAHAYMERRRTMLH